MKSNVEISVRDRKVYKNRTRENSLWRVKERWGIVGNSKTDWSCSLGKSSSLVE